MFAEDHPVVGILGGMGPDATADLLRRVVDATPAEDDIDHIHLLVDNNPRVPSRIAALIDGTGDSPLPILQRMAQRLEMAGAQLLAMPCNTAHYYLPGIRHAVNIPCLDMIALTVAQLRAQRAERVGLLASSAVISLGLYEQALEASGMAMAVPADQAGVMKIIRAVKAGDQGAVVRRRFAESAAQLAAKGVDHLVLACTELSVLADTLDVAVPVLDAMDVLVTEIVAFGKG